MGRKTATTEMIGPEKAPQPTSSKPAVTVSDIRCYLHYLIPTECPFLALQIFFEFLLKLPCSLVKFLFDRQIPPHSLQATLEERSKDLSKGDR